MTWTVGRIEFGAAVVTGNPVLNRAMVVKNPFGDGNLGQQFFDPGNGQAADPEEGDEVYILTYQNDPGGTGYIVTSDDGLTLIDSGASGDLLWWLWHETADATPPNPYNFDISPNSSGIDGSGLVGVAMSDVGTATVGTAGTANSTTCTAPGITMPASGVLVAFWAGFAGESAEWVEPAGLARPADVSGLDYLAGGTTSSVYLPAETVASASVSSGATGSKAATATGGVPAAGDNIGLLIGFV